MGTALWTKEVTFFIVKLVFRTITKLLGVYSMGQKPRKKG